MTKHVDPQLSCDEVKNALEYRAADGVLIWKIKPRPSIRVGAVAGHKRSNFITLNIFGKRTRAHRLIWFMHHGEWPDGEIDHINCNPLDNRIENLRIANRSQNAANCKNGRVGKSGHMNVWKTRNGRFMACVKTITDGFKSYGTYDSAEEAASVAKDAHIGVHGQFSKFAAIPK